MSFTAKVQRTIHAPLSTVWDALTKPELVKQYFFNTNLITSWQPGTPILFEGEWEDTAYQDKGTVLDYTRGRMLRYDYFSSFSGDEDRPENYQTIRYQVKTKGASTVLTITQSNIASLEKKLHSARSWGAILQGLKEMLER